MTALLASGSQLPSLLFTVTSSILSEGQMQASVFLHLIPAPEVGLAYQPSTSEEWYLLSVLLEGGGGCRPNAQPLELLLVILGHGQAHL